MTVSTLAIGLEEARFKAAETVATGLRTLEFYAAAFSKTPDANGDIIDPHAFDDWLVTFYAAGKPLPLSFSHAAVLDGIDPTNVIGYAPANPEHVWVDDYGLRVRGFIDTKSEKGKAVEWQIENDLIAGASIAYMVPPGGIVKKDGYNLIKKADVREAGPTPNPANQEAVLLWMKSEGMTEEPADLPYMTVDEFRATFLKVVDTSAWVATKAMTACDGAADYRSICAAEHTTGTPDERQHWAGPHHYLGKGPNEVGVKAALSRWGTSYADTQLENCTEAEWRSGLTHLQGHMKEINPDYEAASSDETPSVKDVLGDVDLKHAASARYLQAAHDALVRGGAKCAGGDEQTSTAPVETDSVADRLRRLRFMKTSLT